RRIVRQSCSRSHIFFSTRTDFHLLKNGSGILMFDAALVAASQVLTPPFRTVLWKTLALTLALLGLVWIALHKLIVAGIAHSYPWAATALSFISGVGLFIGLAFLVAPV